MKKSLATKDTTLAPHASAGEYTKGKRFSLKALNLRDRSALRGKKG